MTSYKHDKKISSARYNKCTRPVIFAFVPLTFDLSRLKCNGATKGPLLNILRGVYSDTTQLNSTELNSTA